MKRRMANKIENYKILPKRLINKYMSLSFEQGYFSVSIEFKGCVKVYVRDVGVEYSFIALTIQMASVSILMATRCGMIMFCTMFTKE